MLEEQLGTSPTLSRAFTDTWLLLWLWVLEEGWSQCLARRAPFSGRLSIAKLGWRQSPQVAWLLHGLRAATPSIIRLGGSGVVCWTTLGYKT